MAKILRFQMPVKRPKGYCVTRAVRVILYRRSGRGPSRKVFFPPTHPPSLFIMAIRSRFGENPTEKYVIDLCRAVQVTYPVLQRRIIPILLCLCCMICFVVQRLDLSKSDHHLQQSKKYLYKLSCYSADVIVFQ